MEIVRNKVTRTYNTQTIICKKCGAEFLHRENFDIHIKKHMEEETPICSILPVCSILKIFKCA